MLVHGLAVGGYLLFVSVLAASQKRRAATALKAAFRGSPCWVADSADESAR